MDRPFRDRLQTDDTVDHADYARAIVEAIDAAAERIATAITEVPRG